MADKDEHENENELPPAFGPASIGPAGFRLPPTPAGEARDEHGNKYRRRLEDIDPARLDPSAMIEHQEPVRERPSALTVEGYIQGFRDLSDAAITGHGERRSRARMLVIMTLIALLTPVALQLLGLLHII